MYFIIVAILFVSICILVRFINVDVPRAYCPDCVYNLLNGIFEFSSRSKFIRRNTKLKIREILTISAISCSVVFGIIFIVIIIIFWFIFSGLITKILDKEIL